MQAVRVGQAPDHSPLAIVVHQDDVMRDAAQRALRALGYRTFAIESVCADPDSLDGLKPAVVVLDIRRAQLFAARTLVALSKHASAPPVVLVGDGAEGAWLGARFGLLTVVWNAADRELASAVERSRLHRLQPRAPR